jgi:hypothetical protein
VSALESRRRTTLITLASFAAVVLVMAVWGYQAMTAPFEDVSATSTGPDCAPEDQTIVRVVRRAEVTVSVYNTGKRSGRAQDALDLLEAAGFKPGAVGNAPDDLKVPRAEVRTTREDNPAAKLVAASFGKDTRIVVVDEDYGPGIDVFIGDKFTKLKSSAPGKMNLPKPQTTCN